MKLARALSFPAFLGGGVQRMMTFRFRPLLSPPKSGGVRCAHEA